VTVPEVFIDIIEGMKMLNFKFRGVKPQFVLQALFGFSIIAGFMFLANTIFAENILAVVLSFCVLFCG
jgi:hypothetical protein